MSTKDSLRRQLKAKLEALGSEERHKRSLLVEHKLFNLESFRKAACVCFYVSTPFEVDTAFMIDRALREGKKVLVPLTDLQKRQLYFYEIKDRQEDLAQGAFGIMEPRPGTTRLADPDEAGCVIVPGVVFDTLNNRIGRGKGFYDRFLGGLRPGVVKVGLAFSFQVVERIPAEDRDMKMDLVLTD